MDGEIKYRKFIDSPKLTVGRVVKWQLVSIMEDADAWIAGKIVEYTENGEDCGFKPLVPAIWAELSCPSQLFLNTSNIIRIAINIDGSYYWAATDFHIMTPGITAPIAILTTADRDFIMDHVTSELV